MQTNSKPRNLGYREWTDEFNISDFCQRSIKPIKVGQSPSGSWFDLNAAEVNETLARPPL